MKDDSSETNTPAAPDAQTAQTSQTAQNTPTNDIDINDNVNANKSEIDSSKIKPTKNNTPMVIKFENVAGKNAMMGILKNTFGSRFVLVGGDKLTMRVVAENSDTREMIMGLLKERNYKFHTFTPKDEQLLNVVIKRLPNHDDYNPKEIAECLEEWGFSPVFIKPIGGKFNANDEMITWHAAFHGATDIKKLAQVNTILNHRVKIELLKKRDVVQCRNCQSFHHTASNCFHEYRCVKCTEKHAPGQCKLGPKMKPKCVNCGGEHTANHLSQCEAFKRMVINNKSLQTKIQKSVIQSGLNRNNRAIFSEKTFGEIVKSSSKNTDERQDEPKHTKNSSSAADNSSKTKKKIGDTFNAIIKQLKELAETLNNIQ